MDHRTNMAVTHARSAYYTGSRPRNYEFENDTFSATPVTAASEILFSRSGAGKQTLSGGEIRPRNPHEVVSVRSHVTRQRLMRLPNSDAADKNPAPSVQNRLGGKVLVALIKTQDGLFWIENLDDEQSARSEKITVGDAEQKIGDTVKTMSPQRIVTRAYRGATVSYNNEWGEEIRVVEALRISDLNEFLERPNTYIAILEQFPLVSAQIEPVQYKMQLHVVRGQW